MNFEQFGNNAVTLLATGISASGTSVEISSATGFPTVGDFRITVEDEIMIVTSISGTTLTVTRGAESTVAAPHDAGAPVVQSITAGGLESHVKYNVPFFGDTDRPRMNKLVESDGTVLTSSDFTWDNQGSSTISDLNSGGVSLIPSLPTTNQIRGLYKSYTAPKTLKVACAVQTHPLATAYGGVGLRESATGKIMLIITAKTDETAVYRFTNSTTFASSAVARQNWFMGRSIQWFKVEDNNTNIIFSLSMDGINWQQIHSEARGSFFTTAPNQFIFGSNPNSSTDNVPMAIFAWEES